MTTTRTGVEYESGAPTLVTDRLCTALTECATATNIMEGGEWETSVRGIDDASTRFCINSEEH